LTVCLLGALSELIEFTITVLVNGATVLELPTVSIRPLGLDWKASATVLGSSVMLAVLVRPPASVAVSTSSRCEGYSWSGALSEPLATPPHVCTVCTWQSVGVVQ
jgi:hypothetical protein